MTSPIPTLPGVDPVIALAGLGGIGPGRELLRRGVDQDRLDRATRRGEILRIRRGWFALPGADADRVRAVAAGGALSCVSALEQYGLWLMPFDALHVRVPPNHRARGGDGIRVHWLAAGDPAAAGRDPIITALDVAIGCLSAEAALVAVDSALEKRLVATAQLARRFEGRPRHLGVLRRAVTCSQSGTETLVRSRLRGRGIRVRIQVDIPGVGRVDVLVGDRLIVECDGREHHDDPEAFSRDRRRDLAAQTRGFLVVRLSYRQIMFEWPAVEAQLLALIRRDEHLWRVRQRNASGGG